MPTWRILAALVALGAYALLSHALMVQAPEHSWTLALLFGPLLLALAVVGARRRHLPTLAGCVVLAVVLAWVHVSGAANDASRLYVLQHVGIHLALAWSFGLTLRPGGTPLITMIAERVHREFSPAMRDYTRRLTLWWVVYFMAMAVISLALYALAPWPWWSLYCNVLTPLAAASFLVGELVLRRWRHPEFERASLSQALSAYYRRGLDAPQAPQAPQAQQPRQARQTGQAGK